MLKDIYGDKCMLHAMFLCGIIDFLMAGNQLKKMNEKGAKTHPKLKKACKISLESSESLDINLKTIRQVVHNDLNVLNVCATLAPKTLTQDQKDGYKKLLRYIRKVK